MLVLGSFQLKHEGKISIVKDRLLDKKTRFPQEGNNIFSLSSWSKEVGNIVEESKGNLLKKIHCLQLVNPENKLVKKANIKHFSFLKEGT